MKFKKGDRVRFVRITFQGNVESVKDLVGCEGVVRSINKYKLECPYQIRIRGKTFYFAEDELQPLNVNIKNGWIV